MKETLRIRKEHVLMRLTIERLELIHAASQIGNRVARYSWLKWLAAPWFTAAGRISAGSLPNWLKRYPLVSSLVSLLLIGGGRFSLLRQASRLVRWLTVGYAAYQGWRIAQHIKRGYQKQKAEDKKLKTMPPML